MLVLDNATDQQQNTQGGDTMDDIAEASFDLQEVIDSTHHVISRKSLLANSLYLLL